MTETRFYLVFDGELQPGVSPEQAREAIQARFKLSSQQLERLFGSGPVTVKRDLDASSVERYQRAFLDAGAIVERHAIREEIEASSPAPTPDPGAQEGPIGRPPADTPQTATLELLAPGTPVGEERRDAPSPPPDTSRLSLAAPEDSGLEDCAPQPDPPPRLDLSRFQLLPLDAQPSAEDGSGDSA